MSEYNLQLYKLPKNDKDIFSKDFNIKESKYQLEPLLKLGFHYYLHQTKDKMEILDSNEYKNKDFYLVVNNFEHKIIDYDKDIKTITEKFFDIQTKEKQILSRAFYKLWEILFIFDILPHNNSITTAHLAEGPGSFVQSVIMFRDKFNKDKSNDDKYCAITLDNNNKANPYLSKRKLECYSKNNIQRYFQHKSDKNDNGDLTKINVINNFAKEMKDKATLVTADGGFVWKNENYQEQESYNLLLGEILTCLKIQKTGGTFVLKVFDIFTNITIKLICIIQEFYEDVYIYKPFLSRSSNSEKYIIAKKFIPGKDFEKKIKKIEQLLENINNLDNKYLFDIISDFTISDKLIKKITEMNIFLSSEQFIEMNKIITYINKKDYFGEDYHNYKNNQIKATEFWINLFYVKKYEDIIKVRKEKLII